MGSTIRMQQVLQGRCRQYGYTSQNSRQLPSPMARMEACPLCPVAAAAAAAAPAPAGLGVANVPCGRQAGGTRARERHSGQCTTRRSGRRLYLQQGGGHVGLQPSNNCRNARRSSSNQQIVQVKSSLDPYQIRTPLT